MTLRVFLTGQRAFGAMALNAIVEAGYDVAAVCSPAYAGADHETRRSPDGDKTLRWDRLRIAADLAGIRWVDAQDYKADALPDKLDVIVAAHSHTFVGRKSRSRARLASIGYHPSLLPLHRGRDAIRWTIRDGDKVAGGSVYHLTDAIDAGPIAAQDWVFVPKGATADSLWRDHLAPMGIRLLLQTLDDLAHNVVVAVPQDESLATWEPSWERPRLHRPELPELTDGRDIGLEYRVTQEALRR